MIKKLRTIALGTVAITAIIALFATGPDLAQVRLNCKSRQYQGQNTPS